MTKRTLLEVKELVTEFTAGGVPVKAVKGISFPIFEGETVGLVGESGSGKSVTSLSIMKLIARPGRISSGKMLFTNRAGEVVDLVSAGEDTLRQYRGNELAMIFQEPMTSLNPVMRCGEQVMEALLLHTKMSRRAAKEKTIALFEEVRLPEPAQMFDRYPHQLSGGQKQRVMIALAMSCEPRLLIADEPTTALDVTVQKTILGLMKSLQERHGMGILFITHDLGVVAELADRVLVMYKGEIVEQGPVSEVFRAPKHPYTKALLSCRPPLGFRPRRLPVLSDFLEGTGSGSQSASVSEPVNARAEAHRELYARNKILQVRNVRTWFPSKKTLFGKTLSFTKAVDDVSFDVYEGETLGLVGESGCGKTTLGRSILKLAPASAGEIIYGGKDLLRLTEKEFRPHRRDMQIIFQDPYSSLNPRLTIGDAIAEPLLVHGIVRTGRQAREKVSGLLQKVGLDPSHYSRYPHEFSGGQRQRICIARALALNPRFIICDESVSALDVSVQAQVLNLLNDLKKEFRFTSIFISHDLGVVKYMSDRMVVMRKGKIEEIGDPDDIYREPKSEYTRNLIASIPQATLERMAGTGGTNGYRA
jgi:peptide/nickel transport system ATP-binding protein